MEFRVIHCHLLSLNKVGSQGRAAVLTFVSLFQGGVKFPTGGEPAAGKGRAGVRQSGPFANRQSATLPTLARWQG